MIIFIILNSCVPRALSKEARPLNSCILHVFSSKKRFPESTRTGPVPPHRKCGQMRSAIY